MPKTSPRRRARQQEFRDLYARATRARREKRDRIFSRTRLDRVVFQTNQDYVRPLLAFFKERVRRFR